VVATGTPAPTYQWYFDGVVINGASGSTLSLNNVQAADAGIYTVSVKNAVGTVTSNQATLTVNAAITPPSGGGGGGGGGGGAPSLWFCGALCVSAIARWMQRRKSF
jgi:hypothetical protein